MLDSESSGPGVIHDYGRRLLEDVVNVLRACGKQDAEISTAFAAALGTPRRAGVVLRELSVGTDFHLACCDMVFRWRHDPSYLDRSGAPAMLPVTGGVPSFDSLVTDTEHDEAGQYLEYLEAVGAVRRISEGKVELLTDSVLACSGQQGACVSSETVIAHLADFVSTVRFNLENKESNESGRFERACFGRVPTAYVPILQRLVEDRGQNFIDGLDEWLARHSHSRTVASGGCHVGVGAYMYVRALE